MTNRHLTDTPASAACPHAHAPLQVVVYYCRGCLRYLNPPNSWVTADLESRELLQLLLKKLKGLDKVAGACRSPAPRCVPSLGLLAREPCKTYTR